jgi:hypothetical protein
MMAAIEAGFCIRGERRAQDLHPEPLGGQTETLGSQELVATLHGEEMR